MAQHVGRVGRSTTVTPRRLAEWLRSPILWGGVILLTVIGVPTGYGIVKLIAGPAPAVPVAEQPSNAVLSEPVAQPVQQVPEAVAPIAPTVVDYQGTWVGVQGFDPFTIPVEEVLYNGTMNNPGLAYSTETPEGRAYALKVYPDLKDALAILVAIARDPVDKDVVLLSVFAYYIDKPQTVRIAFTVNGGESWCNRDVLPVSGGDAGDVRVRVDGNLITMYGQDARVGYYWWTDTVDKNALPCS